MTIAPRPLIVAIAIAAAIASLSSCTDNSPTTSEPTTTSSLPTTTNSPVPSTPTSQTVDDGHPSRLVVVTPDREHVDVVSAQGGKRIRRLASAPDGKRIGGISLTADGRLAYFAFVCEGNRCPDDEEIVRVSVDGTGAQKRLGIAGRFPVVSGDGAWLAYTAGGGASGRASDARLVLRDLATGNERELRRPARVADDDRYANPPAPLAWSPDSGRLVYGFRSGVEEYDGELRIIERDAGNDALDGRVISRDDIWFPAFADDNTLIGVRHVYDEVVEGPRRILSIDLRSLAETEIIKTAEIITGIDTDATGRHIIYTTVADRRDHPRTATFRITTSSRPKRVARYYPAVQW